MFALLNSYKGKNILEVLLKKRIPTNENLFSIPLVHISNSMNEFGQLSILNVVFYI